MNKRIIIGTIASVSLLALPVAVQARRGADDVTVGIRQEDHQVNKQEDNTTPGADDTTPMPAATPTGAVLSQTTSGTTNPDVTAAQPATTLEDAIAKAKALFADKTVAKTETEQEDGKTIYEIKFTDGSKVEIDAATGNINESENAAIKENNSGHGNSHDDEIEVEHSGRSHN